MGLKALVTSFTRNWGILDVKKRHESQTISTEQVVVQIPKAQPTFVRTWKRLHSKLKPHSRLWSKQSKSSFVSSHTPTLIGSARPQQYEDLEQKAASTINIGCDSNHHPTADPHRSVKILSRTSAIAELKPLPSNVNVTPDIDLAVRKVSCPLVGAPQSGVTDTDAQLRSDVLQNLSPYAPSPNTQLPDHDSRQLSNLAPRSVSQCYVRERCTAYIRYQYLTISESLAVFTGALLHISNRITSISLHYARFNPDFSIFGLGPELYLGDFRTVPGYLKLSAMTPSPSPRTTATTKERIQEESVTATQSSIELGHASPDAQYATAESGRITLVECMKTARIPALLPASQRTTIKNTWLSIAHRGQYTHGETSHALEQLCRFCRVQPDAAYKEFDLGPDYAMNRHLLDPSIREQMKKETSWLVEWAEEVFRLAGIPVLRDARQKLLQPSSYCMSRLMPIRVGIARSASRIDPPKNSSQTQPPESKEFHDEHLDTDCEAPDSEIVQIIGKCLSYFKTKYPMPPILLLPGLTRIEARWAQLAWEGHLTIEQILENMDSLRAFYRDDPQRTFQEYNQEHDYSRRWHFIDRLVAERKKGETNGAYEIKNDSHCPSVVHGFEDSREYWQDTENGWTPTSTRSQNYNQEDQIWKQSGATRSAEKFRPNGSISSLARGLANEANYSKCLAARGITKGQAVSSSAVALRDFLKRQTKGHNPPKRISSQRKVKVGRYRNYAPKSDTPPVFKTPCTFNQAEHVHRRIEAIKEQALQAISFQVGAKRKCREEESSAPRQKRNTYRLRPERHVATFWARVKEVDGSASMREQDQQGEVAQQRVTVQRGSKGLWRPTAMPKPLFPIVMEDGRLEVPAEAIVHGR